MAQLFRMPQLGSTMEEGTILRWHKQEGEVVKAGEILLEIETDKASMEVEAENDGVVRKLLYSQNAIVPITHPIAIIGSADENIDGLLNELGGSLSAPLPTLPTPTNAPVSMPQFSNTPPSAPIVHEKIAISPRARRLADSNGIVLAALIGRGSGPDGRIIEKDIRAYLTMDHSLPTLSDVYGLKAPRTTPLAARIADDLGVDLGQLSTGLPGSRVRSEDVLRHVESSRQPVTTAAASGTKIIKIGGMRKRIADNIVKSSFSAPHVTLTLEVDMTETAAFRTKLLPEIEKVYGVRISYTDIIVKAVARALEDHPMMNAALIGDEIHQYSQINIGVAVALDEGLIVPVIKDVSSKTLGTVSAEFKQVVERARTGKFTPDDLLGGTFSISNLGGFGIDVFDPVINPPQAGILGVCRIAEKAVVREKQVVIRTMMNLCLSFDHRVLDGVPAARFLQRIQELLETPLLILV